MLNKIQKNQRFMGCTFSEKKRKAQISEIMTWIIATIMILGILLLFIYASSFLAQKTKTIKAKDLKIDFEKEVDLLETKTSIAYGSASESERNIIERWREENE